MFYLYFMSCVIFIAGCYIHVLHLKGSMLFCNAKAHIRSITNQGQDVFTFLTLGAHAQRGLQCLVCVSVCLCVCYHVFCHRAQQCAQQDIPADSAGHEQSFKNGIFFKNAWFRSYGVICLPRQRPALLQRPLASFSDDRGF